MTSQPGERDLAEAVGNVRFVPEQCRTQYGPRRDAVGAEFVIDHALIGRPDDGAVTLGRVGDAVAQLAGAQQRGPGRIAEAHLLGFRAVGQRRPRRERSGRWLVMPDLGFGSFFDELAGLVRGVMDNLVTYHRELF